MLSDGRNDLVFGEYDEKWRRLQRYANQNILSHRRVMQTMETYVVPIMDLHKETLENAADAGEPVYPKEMLSRMSARTIADIVFGVFGYSMNTGMEKAIDDILQAVTRGFALSSLVSPVNYFPRLITLFGNPLRTARAEAKTMSSIVDFEALKEIRCSTWTALPASWRRCSRTSEAA